MQTAVDGIAGIGQGVSRLSQGFELFNEGGAGGGEREEPRLPRERPRESVIMRRENQGYENVLRSRVVCEDDFTPRQDWWRRGLLVRPE